MTRSGRTGIRRYLQSAAVLGGSAAILGGALAACSSSSSSSAGGTSSIAGTSGTSTSGTSTGGASTSACLAGADAILATAQKTPAYQLPSTPPDIKAVAGKTFWFISPAQAVPVVAEASTGFLQAAQVMGVKGKVFDGQGSVTEWNAGVSEAVTQHAAAIVLYAENPALLTSSLAQAAAAHIPVVSLSNQEPGTPLQPGVNGALSPDPNLAGTWEAAYALKESNCQGTFGFFYTSTFTTEALQLPTFQSTVQKYCPSCKIVTENIPSSASQSASATIATTAANRYPDMKIMVSAAAANTDVMVPALKALGWKGKLVDWSGSAQNVAYIQGGEVESADVLWPPEGALAFASLDMAARLAAHQTAVAESTPLQLVTLSNIANASALNNYVPQYTALWNRGK